MDTKFTKWLLILAGALVLCASAGFAQTIGQPCPIGGYAAPACPITTDQVIAANVSSRLAGAVSTPQMPVCVTVQNGVVSMVGPVADDRRKQLASFLARTVRGVVCVNNGLFLQGPTATDVQLAGDVRNALSRQTFDISQVDIFVKEGVVDLRGEVNSELARTILGQQAEFVPGVTAVHNNLIVREPFSSAGM